MRVVWTHESWTDYLYWQQKDRKIVKNINKLIKDILRDPQGRGIGHPEVLKSTLAGYRSRHITDEHRLVYSVNEVELVIVSCRYHY